MEEDGTWKLAALKLPESGSPDHLRLSLSSINSKTSTLSPTFAGRYVAASLRVEYVESTYVCAAHYWSGQMVVLLEFSVPKALLDDRDTTWLKVVRLKC